MNQRLIKTYFYFTQTWYNIREINYIEDAVERKDWTYDILTRNFYYQENTKKQKLLILAKLLEKYNEASALSKASYIYALHYNWDKAISLMWQVIYLEKWKNIDSWVDYGFFIRKKEAYRESSIALLLWLEYAVKNYAWEEDILSYLKTIY